MQAIIFTGMDAVTLALALNRTVEVRDDGAWKAVSTFRSRSIASRSPDDARLKVHPRLALESLLSMSLPTSAPQAELATLANDNRWRITEPSKLAALDLVRARLS